MFNEKVRRKRAKNLPINQRPFQERNDAATSNAMQNDAIAYARDTSRMNPEMKNSLSIFSSPASYRSHVRQDSLGIAVPSRHRMTDSSIFVFGMITRARPRLLAQAIRMWIHNAA